MKVEADVHRLPKLAEDANGCLFDERTREFVGTSAGAAALEAMGAVRAAARYLHLLQERWAESQGLSEGRLQILFMLSHFGGGGGGEDGGGISLGRLAGMQSVSPRNITGLVDNLEKAGLIERVPDPDDRRSILARLTPAGRSRIDTISQPSRKLLVHLTADFSEEELVQLRHLSLKLLANAQKIGGD